MRFQWEATSGRCNGLEGKTIIFGPFALCPGTTTRARPPRRRLGREVVQTGAALSPILGRMHSSKPRPRTRSIASVVVVHVRAPVSPLEGERVRADTGSQCQNDAGRCGTQECPVCRGAAGTPYRGSRGTCEDRVVLRKPFLLPSAKTRLGIPLGLRV